MENIQEQLKEMFKDFLLCMEIEEQFYENFLKEYDQTDEFIDEYLDAISPQYFLKGAFIWKESPEGHQFWSEMNSAWTLGLIMLNKFCSPGSLN